MAQQAKKKRKESGKEKFNFVTVVEDDGVDEEEAALFWALDNEQPQGWEEDKEIDYSEMADRSTQSTPSLFSYGQSTSFNVKHLGGLKDIHGTPPTGEDNQSDILESIDAAQRQGRLQWVTHDYDKCVLNVSRYGVKATDEQRKCVINRHPLHCIASVVYYVDTYGSSMVAILVGQGQPDFYQIHVYHCEDEAQAKDICLTLAQAFEAVYNKIQLEQQGHHP